MAKAHGRHTVIKIATQDISPWCKTSEISQEGDEHEVTGYGASGHEYGGDGLIGGKVTLSGTYDNTALTGPRLSILGNLNKVVAFIRQIEGTGTGKPQDSGQVFVKSYVETSPVNDYVQWSAEFTVSGVLDHTAQT